MSCSATAMSSSSNLLSVLSRVLLRRLVLVPVAVLATRAISTRSLGLRRGRELPRLGVEPSYPLAATASVSKLVAGGITEYVPPTGPSARASSSTYLVRAGG